MDVAPYTIHVWNSYYIIILLHTPIHDPSGTASSDCRPSQTPLAPPRIHGRFEGSPSWQSQMADRVWVIHMDRLDQRRTCSLLSGVFATDLLFTAQFREEFRRELDAINGSGIPTRRPNGMNRSLGGPYRTGRMVYI